MKKTTFLLFFLTFCNQIIVAQKESTVISISNPANAPTINKNIYGHFAEHLGRSIYGGFLLVIPLKYLIQMEFEMTWLPL